MFNQNFMEYIILVVEECQTIHFYPWRMGIVGFTPSRRKSQSILSFSKAIKTILIVSHFVGMKKLILIF